VESFDMWMWRQMEGIKQLDEVSNAEVLEHVGEKKNVVNTVLSRRNTWV